MPVAEYVRDTPNLNYVDKQRIGGGWGYSAGGNAVAAIGFALRRAAGEGVAPGEAA